MQALRRRFCSSSSSSASLVDQIPELAEAASQCKGWTAPAGTVSLLLRAGDILHAARGMEAEAASLWRTGCVLTSANGDFGGGKRCIRALEELGLHESMCKPKKRLIMWQTAHERDVGKEEEEVLVAAPSQFNELRRGCKLIAAEEIDRISEGVDVLEGIIASPEKLEVSVEDDGLLGEIEACARRKLAVKCASGSVGVALSRMATKLHIEESQAVHAEGLFRTALDKLKATSTDKESYLRYAAVPMIANTAAKYANLLEDWEKRENEARKLKEELVPKGAMADRMWMVRALGRKEAWIT